MLRYLSALPFALPAFVVGSIVSALVAKRLGKRIGERPALVFLWLACLVLVLSATLTPSGHAFDTGDGVLTTRVWTWALPNPAALFSVNWQSMNLLLFLPLGFASGLFSQRKWVSLSGMAGLFVSVLVEILQFLVIPLGRSQFNSATVTIGWLGVSTGLLMGVIVSLLLNRITVMIAVHSK